MSRRYLVTGGTGFIGAALVRRLLRRGCAVRVLDNNLRGAPRRLADVIDDVEMIEADVRDAAAVNAAARGVDAVLHLAFINGTEYFYSMPELVLDVGVRGMLNVLDACRANGVRELVLASSSEVYQTPSTVPTAEDAPLSIPDPLNPRYSYAGGKIVSELMAINWGRTGFDRVLIVRPHNVIGPDMGFEHVLPQFVLRMARLAAAQPSGVLRFPIQGCGTETRSFIDVEEFVDGALLAMDRGEHLGIYHVGTEEERSIAEVAGTVAAWLGREIELQPGPATAGGAPRRCPDTRRLRTLGFAPVVPFAAAVARLACWYLDNAHLEADARLAPPPADPTEDAVP